MADTDRATRVGIVGLGMSGDGIHCDAIAEVGHPFQVVAGCDADEARLAEVCGRRGARPVASVADMLRDPEVDLVVIATKPYERHVDLAIEVLAAGKDVIVEKPVAMSHADAVRLAEAAAAAEARVFPFQNRRWNLDFLVFSEAIASGVVGDLRYLEVRMDFGPSIDDKMLNWGPHWVDVVVGLTRGHKLHEVSACMYSPEYEMKQVGFFDALLRYEDGLGVRLSFLPDGKSGQVHYLFAAGTQGGYRQNWLEWAQDLFGKQRAQTTARDVPQFFPKRFALIDRETGSQEWSDPATAFYCHLAGVLAGAAEPIVTVDDIVEQFRIIDAILESGRRGEAVKIT